MRTRYATDLYGYRVAQYEDANGHWHNYNPEPGRFPTYPPPQQYYPVAQTSIPFPHGRHVVATILTGGFWLPIYFILWVGHLVRNPRHVTTWR